METIIRNILLALYILVTVGHCKCVFKIVVMLIKFSQI